MQNTEKRTSGKTCFACKNRIAVNSNTYNDGQRDFHLHCVAPRRRKTS